MTDEEYRASLGAPLKWLHGRVWWRQGGTVLIGTGVHCVGCGVFQGITCVCFPEGYVEPPMPDWPFVEGACPLCEIRKENHRLFGQGPELPPRVAELWRELKAARATIAAFKAHEVVTDVCTKCGHRDASKCDPYCGVSSK